MLAKRVIICLTFDQGVLARTKCFRSDLRYTDSFSWAPSADELVLIDVTRDGPWPGFAHLVERYCRDSALPMTIGGHVRSGQHAAILFNSGADRILVGYGGINVYEEIAGRWGSQALVAGIDYTDLAVHARKPVSHAEGGHDAGRISIPEACQDAEMRGAGEILLTSMDLDGSLGGFDLPTLQQAIQACRLPMVVAGGCGNWQHMREAFEAGASGAATTVINHFSQESMRGCKDFLVANYDGPIRPHEGD